MAAPGILKKKKKKKSAFASTLGSLTKFAAKVEAEEETSYCRAVLAASYNYLTKGSREIGEGLISRFKSL